MADIKRYVVGPDETGKSKVLSTEPTNVQQQEGFFWRSTLWGTQEVPVDNTIEGDRSLDGGATRSPSPGGMLCRALELYPDKPHEEHAAQFERLNQEVGQTVRATAEEQQRHATMHRTDTLDCITCVRGEIYLVTDHEEVLMRPGDTVIIRGVNHGWKNVSDEPALLVGSMIDAQPLSFFVEPSAAA